MTRTRILRATGSLAAVLLLSTFAAALAETPANERAPIARRSASPRADARLPLAAAGTLYSTEVPIIAHLDANAAPGTLILNAAHPFSITLTAKDTGRTGAVGPGQAIPENDIFGFFSIPSITGNTSNPEVFVKVIDGRSFNGFYWIFSNSLTDLEYTLTVTEVGTGRSKTYSKVFGSETACGTFDTSAFSAPASGAEPASKAPLDDQAIFPTTRASTLRTAIDFTNTTNKNGVTVEWQYSYTCIAAACSPVGKFNRTHAPIAGTCIPGECLTLQGFDSRHFDDFVSYLASFPTVLMPGAEQGSYGTLLVTFRNLNTSNGDEGTVQARTYARVVEADPLKGTVGFGSPASLFIEAAKQTLLGTARDTTGGGGDTSGVVRSNVGIRNSDFFATDRSETVDLTFYDGATGAKVGGTITLSNLAPGELRETTDIWTAAGIPTSVHSLIVFADLRNASLSSATIEGFITIDDVNSKDSTFIELKCADSSWPCGS
jgi:hypothetical protein